MNDVRIELDGIWKRFRKGAVHDSLRDLIPSLVRGAFRRRSETDLAPREFWALRDVSFQVESGHALGIIGRNGAGKSTTLKILTRVLTPTRGSYRTVGRVGALIEVAAGFHPDLTGRENIFLQAAILGMARTEVAQSFDSIVDFAGVEAFIDTPVKRYSSGMNARLGFAIAAHLRPDVLIIDEVLSVGDMAFQAKCVERMRQFKREGVAIVFVSHNMQAVSDLCERALHLDSGMVKIGETSEVIAGFIGALSKSGARADSAVIDIVVAPLSAANGTPVEAVGPGDRLRQQVWLVAREPLQDLGVALVVTRSSDGLCVYDRTFVLRDFGIGTLEPGRTYRFEASFAANLLRGQYHLEWQVVRDPGNEVLAVLTPAAMFRVEEFRSFRGVAELDFRFEPSAADA
jgi:lipopolysaccharide transport system ATP-binding protein